jgi:hypothetical protein
MPSDPLRHPPLPYGSQTSVSGVRGLTYLQALSLPFRTISPWRKLKLTGPFGGRYPVFGVPNPVCLTPSRPFLAPAAPLPQ